MHFLISQRRCPYSYGKQQVSAVTFPDWFLDMAKRWLSSLNLNDEDWDHFLLMVVLECFYFSMFFILVCIFSVLACLEDKDSMFPNCVNLNLYEHGDHQVAWHSDDEPLFRGKFQDRRNNFLLECLPIIVLCPSCTFLHATKY